MKMNEEDIPVVDYKVAEVIEGEPDLRGEMKKSALALTTEKFELPVSISAPSRYKLWVTEQDKLGKEFTNEIFIPDTLEWKSNLGIVARAFIAKHGQLAWRDKSIPEIMSAIIFADSLGLSFEQQDVYLVEGRLATTAAAKIKYALNARDKEGKKIIKNYHVDIQELKGEDGKVKNLQIGWKTYKDQGIFNGPELEAFVKVYKTDGEVFDAPSQRLSEWFKGSNENWRVRPRYMLGLNSAGKALNMVVPMGGAENEEYSLK